MDKLKINDEPKSNDRLIWFMEKMSTREVGIAIICVLVGFIFGGTVDYLTVASEYKYKMELMEEQNVYLNQYIEMIGDTEFGILCAKVDSLMDAHDYIWPQRGR